MAITMYATGFGAEIKPIEVERATEASVFIKDKQSGKERRRARVTDYCRYHDSWDMARAFLLQKAEVRLEGARRTLEMAQAFHGNVKGLKPPTEQKAG